MSVALVVRVFESALPWRLKSTAAVLALFARDDGSEIYPSVGRLAWLVGKGPRAISAELSELVDRGFLVPLTPRTGGRKRTTRYALTVPETRPPWAPKPRSSDQGIDEADAENPDQAIVVSLEIPDRLISVSDINPDQAITVSRGNPDQAIAVSGEAAAYARSETLIVSTLNPDQAIIRSVRDPLRTELKSNGSAVSAVDGNTDETARQSAARLEAATAPADDGNFAVAVRLAFDVLDERGHAGGPADVGAIESLKTKLATAAIDYRGDLAHRAMAKAYAVRAIASSARL